MPPGAVAKVCPRCKGNMARVWDGERDVFICGDCGEIVTEDE